VRSIENQRLQLQQQWVLRGALDWARLILREDGRNSVIDDLNEPWSTPLAPIQLDQYIESGTSGSGVGNAVLSGSIQDAQGFFNLNNLATQGNVNAPEVQVFARLLSLVRQDTSLANVASKHIAMIYDMANKPPSTLPRPISLVQIDDLLSVPGFTPKVIDAIRPYTLVLPTSTPTNVNTAPPELLSARIPELSLPQATAITNSRRLSPFTNVADFTERLRSSANTVDSSRLSVMTHYFLIRGVVVIRGAKLEIQALVERQPTATRLLWIKTI
jgi:general secretion pathway protein K